MDNADRAASEVEYFVQEGLHSLHQHRQDELSKPSSDVKERFCIDCGEPIPKERLIAVPSARRCVECQQKYERQRYR